MGPGEQIVRRAHEALNAGDIDAVVALCDPGFRLDMSDRVFNPDVYEGHDGIRAFHREVMDVWETFTWEVTEAEEHGDRVLVFLQSTGKARGSGLELDRRAAMVWQLEGGRATALTFYRDPTEARRRTRAGGS